MGRQPAEQNLPFELTNKIKILGIYFQNGIMAKKITGELDSIN